jgi:hypothetical protein
VGARKQQKLPQKLSLLRQALRPTLFQKQGRKRALQWPVALGIFYEKN